MHPRTRAPAHIPPTPLVYEAEEYYRAQVAPVLDDGSSVDADVYIWRDTYRWALGPAKRGRGAGIQAPARRVGAVPRRARRGGAGRRAARVPRGAAGPARARARAPRNPCRHLLEGDWSYDTWRANHFAAWMQRSEFGARPPPPNSPA